MKFVDLKESSKQTSLSVYTLRKYASQFGMPHYRVGRKILINPDEQEAWFKQFKQSRVSQGDDLKMLVNDTIRKLGL